MCLCQNIFWRKMKIQDSKTIYFVSHVDVQNDPLIRKLALETHRSNSSSRVICFGFSEISLDVYDEDVLFSLRRLQLKKIPKFLFPIREILIFLEFFIINLINLLKHKPNLIYAFNYLSLISVLPFCVFNKSVKLIYHARELESMQNGYSRIKSILIQKAEIISFRFVSKLVVPTLQIKNWYLKKFNILIDVEVLLNSPNNDETISIGMHYFSKKFLFDKNKTVFILVGNITHARHIHELIILFESHIDLGVLILMGKIIESEYEYIERTVFKNVYYHENVEYRYLHNYIKQADVGIVYIENDSLSNEFSLANKFLDYACSGIPILCTALPEMMYYIDKYKLGYYFIDNHDEFINKVNLIKMDLKSGIESKVPEELTWERQRLVFQKLINDVLL